MANPVAKRPLDLILPADKQQVKKQKIEHSFVPDISLVSATPLSPQRVSYLSNDEPFDELSSEDLSLPFIELEKKYSSLFETDFIAFTNAIQVGVIHDVDMDQFAVVDGDKVLGTQGVNTCFVVCAKGSTADGQIKLGLCHFSSVQSEDYIIKLIEKKLKEADCKGKIEIYIIGGSLPVPENLDEFPGTLEEEQRLLENASTNGISGVQLHLTQGESAIDVVFTAQKIYWGFDLYAEDTISAGQELEESEEID